MYFFRNSPVSFTEVLMGGGDQHQNEPVRILASPVDHCESDNMVWWNHEEDSQAGSNRITQMRHEYNLSCYLNYLKLDNLSKPEDHCSWVHHRAEDPVSSCSTDVVVERTTRFLNWDQGAKAVGVVSRCHLKCFLLQGFTRLAFCNSLGGAFSSLFYFFLVVCTLTMMVSVSRRLVSKYLILEITGLMVVLLENTTSPLKLISKLVQIVFYLSFSPLCQSAFFPLIKTRIVTCAGNWNWDVTWFNTWILLPLCEIWLR